MAARGRGRGLISLYICIENFKDFLVRNHWTDFNIILQKCSFGDPLPRLFKPYGFVKKHGPQGAGLIFPISLYIYIENFKNLLVRNQRTDFNIILQKFFFGDPLPRLFMPLRFVKNMATRGRGLFSLYICIENFKNLLVRNSWTEFNVTWQECCLVTFYQDCSSCHDTSKTWSPGGRGLFSIYICIENFKILLVKYPLTHFNIAWLECCFGDPLLRFFKQS